MHKVSWDRIRKWLVTLGIGQEVNHCADSHVTPQTLSFTRLYPFAFRKSIIRYLLKNYANRFIVQVL